MIRRLVQRCSPPVLAAWRALPWYGRVQAVPYATLLLVGAFGLVDRAAHQMLGPHPSGWAVTIA